MNIINMDKDFQQGLRRVKEEEVGLIHEGVVVAEDMSLRRSLRRRSTTEVLNNGLDISVIEANNRWRKGEMGRGKKRG